jgi:hypothetical protein
MPEIINNYLSPASFTVSIERMPNVEFFCQSVSIPGLSTQPVELNSPTRAFYSQGDRLSYDDLNMSFIVDEEMNNYQEVLRWLEGIASPETTDQHKTYTASQKLESDISVVITNSHKNPNLKFTFTNAFPTSLGSIDLNVNTQDIAYATCDVTFRYGAFQVENI